jgi:hypothetical protein
MTETSDEDDPYERGRYDWRDWYPAYANPYPKGSHKAFRWQEGHADACDEELPDLGEEPK